MSRRERWWEACGKIFKRKSMALFWPGLVLLILVDDCHPIQLLSLLLVTLGLRCRVQAISSCGEWELLFIVVHGLLIAVASLLQSTGSRHMGFSSCGLRAVELAGSVAVAHGLSCSLACGIVPDKGLNLCPLSWQVDSYPQGSPKTASVDSFLMFLCSYLLRVSSPGAETRKLPFPGSFVAKVRHALTKLLQWTMDYSPPGSSVHGIL